MKLAIMQPYLFPYIGYFQLIQAVDTFVLYDDVQWIKGGWINRNRFLVEGKAHFFTLPVATGDGTFPSTIKERQFARDVEVHKHRILRQMKYNYGKAPYFDPVFALVGRCFACDEKNVSAFVVNSLQECCSYLHIETPMFLSSKLDAGSILKARERVLHLNRVTGSDHYINSIGGIELYDKAFFATEGVRLDFLKTRNLTYRQFSDTFWPNLSILDVMMFNSVETVTSLLAEYDLV